MRRKNIALWDCFSSIRALPILCPCAILLSVACSGFAQSDIGFVREHVAIELDSTKGCVVGKYLLGNSTSVASRLPIFFPIAVTPMCAAPEEVEVRFAGKPLSFSFGPENKSIRFLISMDALSQDTLEICYCQALTGQTFTYVTTTLKGWGRPLREAQFEITCPQEWNLEASYPVEKVEQELHRAIYHICQTEFYPEEDLRIYWNKPQRREEP